MTGWQVKDDELQRILIESGRDQIFKVLFRHSIGETEEDHKYSQSG
jgi:hypothetical protein